MLKAGTPAPEFSARLEDGTWFSPSQLRARKILVLYFYPRDFTPGCRREACAFQGRLDELSARDVYLVGVSADSAESHRAFRETYNLEFALLPDPDKAIIRAYRAETLFGLPARVTYVIDKAGIIRSAFRHDLRIGRHLEDVRRALGKLEPGGPRPGRNSAR